MIKKFIAVLLIIYTFIPNTFAACEEKNYIVILDTPAVYSSERPVLYSENADEEYRNALLELQSEIKAEINGTGISFFSADTDGYSYTELLNGFTMKMTEAKAEEVRSMSGVSAVIEDITIPMATATANGDAGEEVSSRLNSGAMIGADIMHSKGYDGEGRTIAIIDSELDVNHTYFSAPENPRYSKEDIEDILEEKTFNPKNITADNAYRSEKIPFAFNYALDDKNVQPSNAPSHGTHVTGIAAGSPMEGADGTLSGVAPNAQILFFSVFSDSGAAPSSILAAIEDAVKLSADTINLSLGSKFLSENHTAATYSTIRQAIQNAQNAGISVIYASGNFSNGNPVSTDYIDYSTSDNSSFPYAIKAGAAEAEYRPENGQIIQVYSEPAIYSLSSYGYSDSLDISVDFTSPGGHIYSSYPSAEDSTEEKAHKKFALMSGTSMAAPHISGAIALMNQYAEDVFSSYTGAAKVKLIRNLLASTAENIYDENDVLVSPRVTGSGLIDLDAATKTSIYLTASDSDYSRITLGEISDTFDIEFIAHNLSDTDITFNNITAEFSTDDYIQADSIYKFDGLKKLNPSVSGDSPATVPASGSAKITLSVTLDEDEVNYLNTAFKNGFFVDGKITLSGDDNVSVGIPFTGFYGGWEKQPIVSPFTINTELGILTPAVSQNNTYILYKSNADLAPATAFHMYIDRNCRYLNYGTASYPISSGFYNKSTTYEEFDYSKYTKKTFLLPNTTSVLQTIEVREDSISPSITIATETEKDGQMYTPVSFSDAESAISSFILSYDGLEKPLLVSVNSASAGTNISTAHKNATITVFDKAFNSTTLKIGVQISVNGNICSITNNTGKYYSGLCILGVYDGERLADLKILADNVALDIGEAKEIGNVSEYSNKHYKIFFWSNYSPVCEIYENNI